MTIESRNVPSASEILEYVPSSTYIKNQVSSNRRITQLSPDTNNLKGTLVPNTVAKFTIPASKNSLINLSETWFSINGTIQPFLGANPSASNSTFGKIKAGPLWFLPMIQKATLTVGGCSIYDILQPFRLSKFKEMMYYDYNDKINDTLEYQNIPPFSKKLGIEIPAYTTAFTAATKGEYDNLKIWCNTIAGMFGFTLLTQTFTNPSATNGEYDAFCVEFNTKIIDAYNTLFGTHISKSTLTATAPNPSADEGNALLAYFNKKVIEMTNNNFIDCELVQDSPLNYLSTFQKVKQDYDGTHTNLDTLKFQQHLKLSDLFPIESWKPIFNQSIEITLNMESSGFIDIQVDKNAAVDNLQIVSFDYFVFNNVAYNCNVDMINKLNQIYSKPVLEIIDDITVWDGPMHQTKAGGTLPLTVPIGTLWECDFIGICVPQAVSNSYQMKQEFNYQFANTTMHNLADYRFINIQRIEVTLDNEVVYFHNYADMAVQQKGNVLPLIGLSSSGGAATTPDLGNFVPAYQMMKECRWACGRDEKGCIPYNDFLSTGFMFCFPMSAFSRITTNSNINVSITFGPGVESGTGSSTNPTMTQITKTDTKAIDNIRVITKGKRALMFVEADRCQIYNIQESFDQTINVETKTE